MAGHGKHRRPSTVRVILAQLSEHRTAVRAQRDQEARRLARRMAEARFARAVRTSH